MPGTEDCWYHAKQDEIGCKTDCRVAETGAMPTSFDEAYLPLMKSEKCVPERPLGVDFSHALRHATSGLSAEYVTFWL